MEKSKKSTILKVLSWIFFILSTFFALNRLSSSAIIVGTAFLIISIILFPPINGFIKQKLNFEIHIWHKAILIMIIIITLIFIRPYFVNEEESAIYTKQEVLAQHAYEEEFMRLINNPLMEERQQIVNKYINNTEGDTPFFYDFKLDEINRLKIIEETLQQEFSNFLSKHSRLNNDKEYNSIKKLLNHSENTITGINDALDTVKNITNIKTQTKLSSWDADPALDGITLEMRVFSYPYAYVRGKGILNVFVYKGVGLNNVKGELIESFSKELDINDFSVGTCGNEDKYCGFIRELRFEFTKPYTSNEHNDLYVEVTLESQGKTFKDINEQIKLDKAEIESKKINEFSEKRDMSKLMEYKDGEVDCSEHPSFDNMQISFSLITPELTDPSFVWFPHMNEGKLGRIVWMARNKGCTKIYKPIVYINVFKGEELIYHKIPDNLEPMLMNTDFIYPGDGAFGGNHQIQIIITENRKYLLQVVIFDGEDKRFIGGGQIILGEQS